MPIQNVLIIDDSPTERYHLGEILKKKGYLVDVAENAESGLLKAKSSKPDLILMDVVMPGMNGFQATRLLSKDADTAAIPVIICTTKGQETDKVWGMRQGATAYLVKPVAAEDLLARVAELEKAG